MKVLMILGLLIGALGTFGSHAASNELKGSSAIKPKRLDLAITTDKQRYKRHGKIKITAMLTNVDYVNDVFVYGTLGWGYSSSLTYTISDALGRRIQPTILADDLTLPLSRNDTTSFVKLPPKHFLGRNFVEKLELLNLSRPGRYSIFVEYHCPISTTDVDLQDFWSKEDGIIKSNRVWIEVVP